MARTSTAGRRTARVDFDPWAIASAESDAATAAQREVDWWHAHRGHQHRPDPAGTADGAAGTGPSATSPELVAALAASYAYVYGVSADSVRTAARLRAEAMDVSDRWVAAGCDRDDPLLLQERRLLLVSYTALRDAVSVRP